MERSRFPRAGSRARDARLSRRWRAQDHRSHIERGAMMRRIVLLVAFVAFLAPAARAAAQTTIMRPLPPGTQPPMPMPMPGGRGAQPGADLPPGTATLRGHVFAA